MEEQTVGGELSDVRKAAVEYRTLGFAVARIRPGQKRPTDAEWTVHSAAPKDIGSQDGLGLVCGLASNGGKPGRFLVCVDLDNEEAIRLAPDHLPDTGAKEGRGGKPSSHWWFLVENVPPWATSKAPQAVSAADAKGVHPGPFKKQFRHAETGTVVIDFIGSGGQAVVPPSLHEKSGEYRRWEPGCSLKKIATVEFETLWNAVCALAKAAGARVPEIQKEPKVVKTKAEKSEKAEKNKKAAAKPAAITAGPSGHVVGTCTRESLPSMEERVRQCERYLGHVELARSGYGGHKATYRVARLVVNDFVVNEREKALELMKGYNDRLEDKWSETEMAHKIDSAMAAGPDPERPFGCKLSDGGDSPPRDPAGWGNPSPVADAFVRCSPVLFYSGRYFRFNGRCYDELDLCSLKAQIWGFLEEEAKRADPKNPPKVSRALRDNVVAAIEARGAARFGGREHEITLNSWLPGKGSYSGDTLVLKNGLLDVATGTLHEHSPEFFGLYGLPYDYDPAAACPTWEKAVERICGGDAELKLLVQQWFGYCLTSSTDHQKFMVLVGDGANGKSTLVGGLLAVVGKENASNVALERFSGSFDLGYTLGKLVNVPDDMAEIDKANEGILKSYTSGGGMSFNQKNKPILFARPTAKLMFCTNTVPRFTDRSSGIWRRLLLIPLNVVIPEGERVAGMDKPAFWERIGELAGMLNWALAGLKSLREAARFVIPECVKHAVAEHQVESNPTRVFLTEHVREAEGESIPSQGVYAAYRAWMTANGHTPMAHVQFTKEARRVFPKAERSLKRSKDGKQERILVGIAWTEEAACWTPQVVA